MNMINVTKSSLPPFKEYCDEIEELWGSRWLTNMGEKHNLLEAKLENYLSVSNVSLFCNGHSALEGALEVMDFPKGSEIITTPFTFVSTINAIYRRGLIPVFCDINEEDYTIDVNRIPELISEKTVAILPVHVYGNICDVKRIDQLAKQYDLKVIYDAAHAFGVRYKGVGIAEFGDMTMFSFHATKVFNTIEGGALAYGNDCIKQRIEAERDFGIVDEEQVDFISGNAKMNEFQAAMGLCNLRHLADEIEKRKGVSEEYDRRLSNKVGIKIVQRNKDIEYNYSYYPVLLDKGYDRNVVFEKLKKEGINARKYFYPLVSDLNAYKEANFTKRIDTEVAHYTAQNILTLPLYADLDINSVNRICDIILS